MASFKGAIFLLGLFGTIGAGVAWLTLECGLKMGGRLLEVRRYRKRAGQQQRE